MKFKLKQQAKKTNKKSVVGSTTKKGNKLNFNKAFLITAVFSSLALLGVAGWNTWQFKKIEAQAYNLSPLPFQIKEQDQSTAKNGYLKACKTRVASGDYRLFIHAQRPVHYDYWKNLTYVTVSAGENNPNTPGTYQIQIGNSYKLNNRGYGYVSIYTRSTNWSFRASMTQYPKVFNTLANPPYGNVQANTGSSLGTAIYSVNSVADC